MPKTLGQYLLNAKLPTGMSFTGPVDKKALTSKLIEVGRASPSDFGQVVQGVKEFGDFVSTYEGISVGLDDIEPDYGRRDQIIREAKTKLKRTKDVEKRREIILDVQDRILKTVGQHNSDMGMMARSGGRGSVAQLMKTVAFPGAIQEKNGEVIPWMIQRSYSEGLRPDEVWVTNTEARRNAIATKESVSEPGAFGKILTSNMQTLVVVGNDCGTSNGVNMDLDDTHILDRYTATSAHGLQRNRRVDIDVIQALKKQRVQRLLVRSPMTCELPEGVCQMCYGRDEKGQLPKIGVNLGVRSAQAMSEPLTQFALNAKHGVRLASKKTTELRGLKGLQNFLDFPKSFTRKATLSEINGTVEKIRKAPQGGHFVTVKGTNKTVEHYVAPNIDVPLRQGDSVYAGDALSSGVPMPNEVVKYKGLGAGRQHIADTVHDIYKRQGANLDKRHSELLARSHLNYVRVVNDVDGDHINGEIVPFNAVQKKFEEKTKQVALSSANGKVLGGNVLQYTAGTTLTPPIIDALRRDGVSKVPIYEGDFRVRPIVKSITRNPLLDPDWMGRMGHRYLKKTLLESAAEGSVSSIHSTHPIPAYVFGAEFGQGPSGKF